MSCSLLVGAHRQGTAVSTMRHCNDLPTAVRLSLYVRTHAHLRVFTRLAVDCPSARCPPADARYRDALLRSFHRSVCPARGSSLPRSARLTFRTSHTRCRACQPHLPPAASSTSHSITSPSAGRPCLSSSQSPTRASSAFRRSSVHLSSVALYDRAAQSASRRAVS